MIDAPHGTAAFNAERITLKGPHGSFVACAHTGRIVTPMCKVPPMYRAYNSVDVLEFRRWCDEQRIGQVMETSILCVGLRRSGGQFDAPVDGFREEWAAMHLSSIDIDLA